MKIYFAGSIRGGRDDKELYEKIIELLSHYGTILTEHVGDKTLSSIGEIGLTNEYIYTRDMNWLKEADVVVAEVTTPSLGVGYEISKAEDMGKSILCIFRENDANLSAMISGNNKITVEKYSTYNNLEPVIARYFKQSS